MSPRRGIPGLRAFLVLTTAALVVEVLLALIFPGSVGGPAGEAVALVWLALLARQTFALLAPGALERAARPREEEAGVAPPLVRLRRALEGGTRVAGDFHVLLRPVLRSLAAGRLRRHGVDLDRDEPAARALLGDEGYALVRPDRAPPEDRFAPGPSAAAVERLAERLEAL